MDRGRTITVHNSRGTTHRERIDYVMMDALWSSHKAARWGTELEDEEKTKERKQT